MSVATTGMAAMSASGQVSGSPSRMTRSASLPGSSEPFEVLLERQVRAIPGVHAQRLCARDAFVGPDDTRRERFARDQAPDAE